MLPGRLKIDNYIDLATPPHPGPPPKKDRSLCRDSALRDAVRNGVYRPKRKKRIDVGGQIQRHARSNASISRWTVW